MLGASLLAALALLTYSPTDPIFERALVANRAGIIGAAVAAVLFGTFGYASAALVGGLGVIGVRLILGRGLPGPTSRFWVSVVALLLSISALSPIAQQASPYPFKGTEGGVVGAFLAEREQWLVGTWGAVIGNVVLLMVGVLSATGISAGTVLHYLGIGLGWLGTAVAGMALALARIFLEGVAALRRAASETVKGVERGSRAVWIWRERRTRRVRAAASHESEADAAVDTVELSGTHSGERIRGSKQRRSGPTIVDHAPERPGGEGVQEAFTFKEEPSGPYLLPDISVFQRPPEGSHKFDHDSLIINSRIL